MDKNEIIEALSGWNFWHRDINAGILRPRYLDKIRGYLSADEIVALSGVRRSGKSTILLQVLKGLIGEGVPKNNILYINFEDPKFYSFLKLDLLDNIWQAYFEYLRPKSRVYLVLDEVQKIKGWEQWVRSKYDRKENIKIFVTGSNSELLSSEFSSVLTGRHLELKVAPLDFKEFLDFKGLKVEADKLWFIKNKKVLNDYTGQYLQEGGFPKIVL